jgi:hypothetical protein
VGGHTNMHGTHTFEESVVLQVLTRGSMLSLLKSNLLLILSRFSVATCSRTERCSSWE